ncbi:MAG TPA: sigma-70 family RNA polymerase sigma factor [Pseudonocardiaceae bacterium]|nr:sigma-70 family RNA polymerase sigma factor [Pseudonocardiaceae bacterium]
MLTRDAQAGEVAALGALLARHHADMRAVALAILGYHPDTDDAVQEAALIALRRIGDVRDPESVGPWLRQIVRNVCRMRLRARSREQFGVDLDRPSDLPNPEQVLEDHALRDWVWHAIEQLSPPLRMTLMLRHFSGVNDYAAIATACGVPVGTVRSRLSEARTKLTSALLSTADDQHPDANRLARAARIEAVETIAVAERGGFATVAADRWTPDFQIFANGTLHGDATAALAGMESDLTAGVHQRLRNAVASRDLMIWEMRLISPPDDPEHCPPGVVWLMSLVQGRVQQLRLFHQQSL